MLGTFRCDLDSYSSAEPNTKCAHHYTSCNSL